MRIHLLAGIATSLTITASFAVLPPDEGGPLRQKELRHPDLDYRNVFRPVAELPADVIRNRAPELVGLRVDPSNAYFDRRTGRWGMLILTTPLIPGPGKGNHLRWSAMGYEIAPAGKELEQAAWKAFREYLIGRAAALHVDPAELGEPRVTALGRRLIQFHVGRAIDGISFRDTFIKAAVNSGNLVLLGARNWGDVDLDTSPRISESFAEEVLHRHVTGVPMPRLRERPRLEIVPVSDQPDEADIVLGEGLEYRLAWVLRPYFENDLGSWEALVDAHSGELLSFQDLNHYASRRIEGGIFPVSNDGVGDDGTLQLGFPMPFADVALDGSLIGFTTAGGNVPAGAGPGEISTALSGRYMRMNDGCGAIDESAATGDLDLDGVPLPGTDCQIPPGHSPGDTNASRTGFYELNRLAEQARGYIPGNAWVNAQLTANMNINNSCNAFWSPSAGTVNFYTSGIGTTGAFCANTGEIAAIFDHEWGHGMDNNDNVPAISRPGEGIADIFAQNRLVESCIGRNFRPGINCTGYGDGCLDCTGVRETDWAKHASGQPHDVDWILSNCPSSGGTPCGRGTHCEGHVVSESAWDLVHRDLQGFGGSLFDLDLSTALEIGTRLAFHGSSNVFNWYQCATDGTGGCNIDSGYLGYLVADDDNGDLTDGTPHMSAIHAAFDRHGIACPAPTVQNSGCDGGPAQGAKNLAATPLNEAAQLTWDAVPDAEEYWIFRTEGVNGCDFGKALVGTTTATEFTEFGLRNGFEVLYSVLAVSGDGACTGPMTSCAAVTPVPGPGFSFDPGSLGFEEGTGDGDGFFDNCETATLTFELTNTGEGELTNVRIVEASSSSHPDVVVLTELPSTVAASLSEGESTQGELVVLGGGFEFDDTLRLQVGVTSDELEPVAIFQTYTLVALESDPDFRESVTFDFEKGVDGWQVVDGTFDRTNADGGADDTDFYLASSSNVHMNCDRMRSPILRLTETSELALYNQFDIEDFQQFWWDRANVGVFDPQTGEREVVSPESGRPYNASGSNPWPAPCVSHDPPASPGWAGAGPGWMTSSWSPKALGSAELAGRAIQLDVAYGTDPATLGAIGFWFDEVTVTDVFLQVPDGQADICFDFAPAGLTVDTAGNGVFEPGESVMVAPSWQNLSTIAGTLAGTAEAFSGPASGALYSIVDSTAGYGSVDPDDAASCTATGDCYRLSVFGTSARPAQHWDAVFEEALSDETTQTWTLHLGDSFVDLPRDNLFYRPVETLLHSGITDGCTSAEYCPASSNSRAQMAVFLLRAVEGGDYTPPACVADEEEFFDVPAGNAFCPWIEDVAARGVTSGCGGGNYCPADSVTRAQMAVFLLKAAEGDDYVPPPCTGAFSDVLCPSTFAAWIEDLAARGITGGCSETEYCPATPVTRAQMASFLTRAFGFQLYGP